MTNIKSLLPQIKEIRIQIVPALNANKRKELSVKIENLAEIAQNESIEAHKTSYDLGHELTKIESDLYTLAYRINSKWAPYTPERALSELDSVFEKITTFK